MQRGPGKEARPDGAPAPGWARGLSEQGASATAEGTGKTQPSTGKM